MSTDDRRQYPEKEREFLPAPAMERRSVVNTAANFTIDVVNAKYDSDEVKHNYMQQLSGIHPGHRQEPLVITPNNTLNHEDTARRDAAVAEDEAMARQLVEAVFANQENKGSQELRSTAPQHRIETKIDELYRGNPDTENDAFNLAA